jgi:hypothetical protein
VFQWLDIVGGNALFDTVMLAEKTRMYFKGEE